MPDGQIAISTPRTTTGRSLSDSGAVVLLCLAALLLRLTAFVPAVVDTDEGLYLVQAREWLHGGWPLVAAWDMHPIGAPAMFALAFVLFGVSVEAVRLLGTICVAATACALYGAVRATGAPRGIGLGAGVIYAALSVLLSGLCTNTEILIGPFIAGAMALAIRGAARAVGPTPQAPGWGSVAAMGLLVGCALLVKQVVVPEGSLAFVILVLPALARGVLPFPRAVLMALAYAALCAAPFALAGLAYWSQGWLDQYLDGSLLAPFRYSMERIAAPEAARRIGTAALQLGLVFAAALVAVAAWRPRWTPGPIEVLTGGAVLWFATTSAAIAGPGFFFAHYFLLWLPPLALLAAIGAWWVARSLAKPERMRTAFIGLVAILAAQAWLVEASARLERGPGLMHRDPVREVAAAVHQAAGPDGDAFIANYHPSVYVLADVRLTTRFPFPAHLTGEFEDLSDTNTHAELDRVLAARPKVIVVDRGWMQTMRPAAAQQVMAAVASGYELFASVPEQRGPVEIYRRK